MERDKKSIFQRAAEWGVPFGLYLACGGISYIYADHFAPLSVLFFTITLFAPVVTYYFQRRKFIEDDGFTEYAGLWMLGIMLYILGTTLASFFIYLVLEHLRPNFIYDQAQAAIKVYSSLPEMRDSEVLLVLKRMVNEKLLPSPIEMVFNVFWFVTFAGSVSSAISALIAQRSIKRPIKKN